MRRWLESTYVSDAGENDANKRFDFDLGHVIKRRPHVLEWLERLERFGAATKAFGVWMKKPAASRMGTAGGKMVARLSPRPWYRCAILKPASILHKNNGCKSILHKNNNISS